MTKIIAVSAAAAVVLSTAAGYFWWLKQRQKQKIDDRNRDPKFQQSTSFTAGGQSNFIEPTVSRFENVSIAAAGVAERVTTRIFPSRTIKAVFVVNKSRIVGKRSTYLAVSSAVIRLYTSLQQQQSTKILSRYLNQGQMKVVVKGENGAQLQSIANDAERRNVHAIMISCADRCLPIGDKRTEDDEPAIVAVIGAIDVVDKITGHLKLM